MTKVMLVEDDNNLREIYQDRMQAEGFEIIAAKDGEEALAIAKNEKPDLIISDVMMPKISGFEMLDIIRNTPGLEAVKVIMLTALGQNDDQQRGSRLGANRYLVKSQVTLEDIVKAAHEVLNESGTPPAGSDKPTPATDAASPGSPSDPPATANDSSAGSDKSTATPADSTVATDQTNSDTTDQTQSAAAPATTEIKVAEPPKDETQTEQPAPEKAEVKPDSSVTIPVKAEPATTEAEPVAKEEATVEAQIEDFIAQENAKPEAPASSAGTPSAAPESEQQIETDMKSTPDLPAVGSTVAPKGDDNGVKIAHKKVISRPDTSQKDINELLKQEEAAAADTEVVTPDKKSPSDIQPAKVYAKPPNEGEGPANPADPGMIAL